MRTVTDLLAIVWALLLDTVDDWWKARHMKRLTTTALLMVLAAAAYTATLPFGTAAEYVAAARASLPGDTLTATANVALPSDCDVPAGVTLSLAGFTLSAPAPTSDKPNGFRFLRIVGSGTTIEGGTIDNAGWGVFTAYTVSSITIRNVTFSNVRMAALKISPNSGPGGTRTDNLLVENVTITSTGHPNTLLDCGPGAIGAATFRHISITGPPIDPDYNMTSCDGMAVENGDGPILIEDVTIVGAPGDGMDVKNAYIRPDGTPGLVIRDVTIRNTNRNGLKAWGYQAGAAGADQPTAKALIQRAHVSGCGLEAVAVAAGDMTIEDSVFESPTVTANLGNGTVNGARVRVYRSKFIRTGEGRNALILTDGGDGKPTLPDPVQSFFASCAFDPGQASALYLVKAGSTQSNLSVADARAGKWPSNFVGCSIGAALPPVVDPPPPPPPESDLAKLTATVAALSAKVDALSASVAAQNTAQAAKWTALAAAINAR